MDHLAMQRLSHAEEPLELVRLVARDRREPRHAMGVVRGELRIEAVGAIKQSARGGEIGNIRIHLAREHGISREPGLLGPFDLAVPIGAFDEPHRDAPCRGPRHPGEIIDQRQRPLAVGLNRKPEPVPV